ncbi:MAG: phosphoglycerate kinase [Candidatus Gracilibacteria bacterium]|nr:phosphoglycerate kinase [Candidatus Gracilibacteria bacterium]
MNFLSDLDFTDKRVLYRVDINSSISDGAIADDTRIQAIVPTLKLMLDAGAKQVVILAHQGRGREKSPKTVLNLHAVRLSELMEQEVIKLDACRGVSIPAEAKLVMLENVRLDDEADEDVSKREAFANELSEYGDVYVNDAFAACHRDHATISALPRIMTDKAAGLLLQKELEALQPLLDGDVEHPFTMIVAGAKIDTKIGVIQQFYDIADHVLLGGGIANTFLAAEGYDVGESLKEEDKMELAREIALEIDKRGKKLHIPDDVICADEISEDAVAIDVPIEDVMGSMKILDIGRKTAKDFARIIKESKAVIWNGPVGLAEISSFRNGSEMIARAMVDCEGKTFVGGGESVGVINSLGISHDSFTHVSTGGGAMLEFLSGEKLPGVEALS